MTCIPLHCLLLSAPNLAATVYADEAKATLGRMAGLAKVVGQNLIEDRGALTTRIDTPLGAVALSIMRGPKDSWIAILQPQSDANLHLATIWPVIAGDAVARRASTRRCTTDRSPSRSARRCDQSFPTSNACRRCGTSRRLNSTESAALRCDSSGQRKLASSG